MSVSAHTVYAIPAQVEDAQATAKTLASMLNVDEEFILERLQKHSAVEWIKKKITDQEARAIIAADLPGIGGGSFLNPDLPLRLRGASGVGLCGHRQSGFGRPRALLRRLSAWYPPGQTIFERDAQGRALEDGVRGYLPGKRGGDPILTLDIFIQRIAEEEVRRATLETGSRLGLIFDQRPQDRRNPGHRHLPHL